MTKQKLNVLIVDDEEIVRAGLKNIIDWEANGYHIAGEAENADDTLEKISELKPALVLMDINMPGKTGINIIEEINSHPEIYPEKPFFLILSGYSDFEYAKRAINAGAKGYIVKPVDEDILVEKIQKIAEEIEHESEVAILRTSVQKEELIKKFSQMFLFGAVEDGFEDTIQDSNVYQTALISSELCGLSNKLQIIQSALEKTLTLTNCLIFPMAPLYVVVFKNESVESVTRHLNRFCMSMNDYISGAIVALGKKAEGLEGALESYNEARIVYKQLFFFSKKNFITINDLFSDPDAEFRIGKKESGFSSDDFFTCIPKLVSYIEIYDLKKIEDIILEQRNNLHRSRMSVNEIKKLNMAFIVDLQNYIHNKHPEKTFTTVSALDLVNLIYTQKYFDEMTHMVKDFVMGLAETFTSNSANSIILKVLQYVKSNYNSDLKLEMLGDLFNCNSAYLGKRFKEYTGVPFNTYMDVIRIEKAKELIASTDLKIYEISKLVGYSNTDYFYLKFKKHTGMTPKEYKMS